MVKTYHYGLVVDSEVPTTGVVNASEPEFLYENIYDWIDLDFEVFIDTNPGVDPEEYCNDNPTMLAGFIKDENKSWIPDPDAEYSAIISEAYAQILASKYVSRTTLCSPCFPGQGDLSTKGEYLTFTFPPELWGNRKHLEIIKIEDNNNDTKR